MDFGYTYLYTVLSCPQVALEMSAFLDSRVIMDGRKKAFGAQVINTSNCLGLIDPLGQFLG